MLDILITNPSQDFMINVCPRPSEELQNCFENLVNEKMANIKNLCLSKITEIYKTGEDDLKVYLESELFPKYIDGKISERLKICRETQADLTSAYSQSFIDSFENSDFYEKCSSKIEGMTDFNDEKTQFLVDQSFGSLNKYTVKSGLKILFEEIIFE